MIFGTTKKEKSFGHANFENMPVDFQGKPAISRCSPNPMVDFSF
jgi:hypothetical protein